MLGSMGLATSIGLGVALNTDKEVVVVDGDGSLLMNPGCLATVAGRAPINLSILAVDNSVHGSTGNQPTLTGDKVHLGMLALAMGIENTSVAVSPQEAAGALRNGVGPRFVHVVAKPGNADVPNIPLSAAEIKLRFMNFLKKG
jgi:sulfopyruvate decarboxylase subunit beta